jgi:putative FmdB family regulatory protein
MPTYEYRCEKCGNTFEIFQKMSDEPLSRCPECGGSVKKLIGGGAGIIFKGKGFYQTDYKNGGSSDTGNKDEASRPCGKEGDKCSSCPD